jgi:hypothetical protein
MSRIPFAKIIRLAKEQTGKNRPTTNEVSQQLHNDAAADLICRTASEVLGEPVDKPVADNNDHHYAVEDLIGMACVEIYDAQTKK